MTGPGSTERPAGQVRVHLVGLASTRDAEANRGEAVRAVQAAARAGADLVVLPEFAAAFDPRGVGPDLAEPLDGPFVTALREATGAGAGAGVGAGVTVIAGLVVPDDQDLRGADHGHGRARNVVVAVRDGELVGSYTKVHLYDAFGMRESDLLVGGDPAAEPLVVAVGGLRVGVLTCYDLRFPESARRCVDAGATALVVPAAWAGSAANRELKTDHWRTLLRARAIESTTFALGVAMRGRGVVGPLLAADPLGCVLAEVEAPMPGATGWVDTLVVDLDPARVAEARATNPSLSNRRYRVEPG